MEEKKKYFENVPLYGDLCDLYIDKVLFSYDNLPIVFVLKDFKNNYFLSICTDSIFTLDWIITKVSTLTLIGVLKNEIPIFRAFEISKEYNEIIIAQEGEDKIEFSKKFLGEFDDDDLPSKDEYLDAGNKFDEYIEQLSKKNSFFSQKICLNDNLSLDFNNLKFTGKIFKELKLSLKSANDEYEGTLDNQIKDIVA